jgi:hypothetical protein
MTIACLLQNTLLCAAFAAVERRCGAAWGGMFCALRRSTDCVVVTFKSQ